MVFDRNLFKLDGMRPVMAMLVVLALLQAAAIVGQAWTLSHAVSALWAGEALSAQTPFMAAFFACFAAFNLVRFGQECMLDNYSMRTAEHLRLKLLTCAFDKDTLIAGTVGSSALTVSATDGVDEIASYIRIVPPKAAGLAAICAPLLFFSFAIDVVSGIILAIMLPIIVFFMVLLGKNARLRSERQYSAYHRLSNRFIDTLRGMDVIESFGAGSREEEGVYRFSEKLRTATIRTLSVTTLSSAVLDLCSTFGVAAVAIMLAFRLMDSTMQLAPALCLLMIAPEFFAPIRSFASDFHASLDGKNALSAVLETIGAATENAVGDVADNANGNDRAQGLSIVCPNEKVAAGLQSASTPENETCILSFRHVTYSYDGETPALANMSFDVYAGEHIAIVGKSGAGKSTLASLAAGLIVPDSGVVLHSGAPAGPKLAPNVRFIPQHPHVFRASLLENIRFYAPEAPRAAVESACSLVGLDDLVAELPDGIDTLVGEGERGLSGGQAHRIALARILLDDKARIIVLDEPTAHLDIETELDLKTRMSSVFRGRTVLFATHRLHWLSEMDRALTLEDGKMVKDEPTCSMTREQTPETAGKTADATHASSSMPITMTPQATPDADKPSLSSNCEDESNSAHEPDRHEKPSAADDADWAKRYLKRYRRHIAIALFLGLATAAFAALLMFASGYLISQTAQANVTLFAIMLPVAFVQVFGLGKPVARYFERLVSHDWVFKITSDLRRVLFRAIRKRTGDPAKTRATGEYLALLDDDLSHLQNAYLRVAFPTAIAYLLALCATIAFGLASPAFALAMAALFLLCALVIPVATLSTTRSLVLRSKHERTTSYVSLADDLAGAVDWALAGRSSDALKRHASIGANIGHADARTRLIVRDMTLGSTLLLGAGACFVVAWASRFADPSMDPNLIAAYVLGFFPLIETFSSLPSSLSSLTDHRKAIERLGEFAENHQESDMGTRASSSADSDAERDETFPPLPGNDASESRMRAHRYGSSPISDADTAISLSDIAYTYPTACKHALDEISIDIASGQKVAILGKSGSGKTTLVQVMRGMIAPEKGTLHLFGNAIEARKTDLSHTVGYLAQTPYLFDRTLRENLLIGAPDADDERLLEAIRSVGLAEKIDSLKSGLDTPIGETGIGLSGGQEHRLALARVLVADAPIIIVDEPFSALDPNTERDLLDTLFAVAKKRTLVVVTHHLAQIERFDRVLFIEEGRVALDGNPKDLAQSNARFAELLALDRPQMQ